MFESTRRAFSAVGAAVSTVCAGLALVAGIIPQGEAPTTLPGVRTISSLGPAQVAPPPPGGYFPTLLPGSALPSEAECAQRVRPSTWEPRPENYPANQTIPTSVSLPAANQRGQNAKAQALIDRVSGKFSGTTDEIIQWASCKWGFSDEVVRAVAVAESYWYQGVVDSNGQPISDRGYGDFTTDASKCADGYTAPCPKSFGIQQVKHTSHPGTFPSSRDSTAFNLDYTLMYRRVCYEGWMDWLKNYATSPYVAGDEWGCVGHWYSGGFHDSGAETYTETVKRHLSEKVWRGWADTSGGLDYDATTTVAYLNDNDSAFRYSGSWSYGSDSKAYKFDEHWSYTVNGYYEVTFTGTQANLFTTKGSKEGIAAVSVDGGPETLVDTYAPTRTTHVLVYTSPVLPNGTHTLKVRVTGTKNASSTNTAIHADRVGAITSSASTTSPPPAEPSADTTAPTVSITSPASGTTVGSRITIKASASDNVGVTKMKIYIDGNLKTTSSTGSISYSWNSKKASRGQHTITVKALDAAGNTGQTSVSVSR